MRCAIIEYSKELSLRNQPLETQRWISPEFLGNRLAGPSVYENIALHAAPLFLWHAQQHVLLHLGNNNEWLMISLADELCCVRKMGCVVATEFSFANIDNETQRWFIMCCKALCR